MRHLVRSKLRHVGIALLVLLGGVIGFPTSSVSAEFTHRLFRNKLTFHFPCVCRSSGATEVRIAAASWVKFAVLQWLALKLDSNWRHCRNPNLSLCSRSADTKTNIQPLRSGSLCVETCLYVTAVTRRFPLARSGDVCYMSHVSANRKKNFRHLH
jgi:hypothetical protein